MPLMQPGDEEQANFRASVLSPLGLGAFRPTALRSRLERLRDRQERLVRDLISTEQEAAALERLLES